MLTRAAAVTACASVLVALGATAAAADPVTPAVDHLSPANSLPGRVLDIVGTGLTGTTEVAFTGAAASVAPTSVTDTDVTVTIPADAHDGAITLTTPSGPVTGPSFAIEHAAITRSASYVVFGSSTHVTGTFTAAGAGLAGQQTTLLSRTLGRTTWTVGPSLVTNSAGVASYAVHPAALTEYTVKIAASALSTATRTGNIQLAVRPTISVTVPVVAPLYTARHFTGAVHPGLSGPVVLQQLVSGTWKGVSWANADSAGRFSIPVKAWTVKGRYTYRVHRNADSLHMAAATTSHTVLIVDRTLRQGMTGPDVTFLQSRLRTLHYDVPAVTGTFNYDTTHAVIAFQKLNGLTRTGVVGPTDWARLGHPLLPRLLHPSSGAEIEVDLTKQVLYYAVNKAVVRILDVSTGGGYTYTGSDGQPSQAITPVGHFSVKYKVDHWVTSKLGTLYKPAYFNYSGYAIHGEGAVPVYPASHGCVRITVPAMDRLYSKLVVGMPVWIYRT